jgi:hypothetical protein
MYILEYNNGFKREKVKVKMFDCHHRQEPRERPQEKKVLEIPKADFLKFLAESKREGYASDIEPSKGWFGTKCFFKLNVFIGDVLYHYQDEYSGYFESSGNEIVAITPIKKSENLPIENPIPIWVMSYGFHPEDGMQHPYERDLKFSKETFKFLKQALSNPNPHFPVRGPKNFESGNFLYIFNHLGSIEGFTGKETIIYRNKPIFQQNINGKLLQHKNLEVRLV